MSEVPSHDELDDEELDQSLAEYAGIRTCPEIDSAAVDEDDEQLVETTFGLVSLPWNALGLIEFDARK